MTSHIHVRVLPHRRAAALMALSGDDPKSRSPKESDDTMHFTRPVWETIVNIVHERKPQEENQ